MAAHLAERIICFSQRASRTRVMDYSASSVLPTLRTNTTIQNSRPPVHLGGSELRLGPFPPDAAFSPWRPLRSAHRQRWWRGNLFCESLFPPDPAGHLHHHEKCQDRSDGNGQPRVAFKEKCVGKQH